MQEAQHLALYGAAWETTQRMLEAANAEEWDALIELGLNRDVQLAEAIRLADRRVSDVLAAEQLAILMRQILTADQEIQKLSQDWMQEIQGVLSSVQVEQKLLKAYDPL